MQYNIKMMPKVPRSKEHKTQREALPEVLRLNQPVIVLSTKIIYAIHSFGSEYESSRMNVFSVQEFTRNIK